MDNRRRQLLIRNTVAGAALLALLLVIAAFLGVFERDTSDEAQIRRLMSLAGSHISDNEWDALLRLCDLTPEEEKAWRAAIPPLADRVVVDAITPHNFLSVPEGATEHRVSVTVFARLTAPFIGDFRTETLSGEMHFVRRGPLWRIDLDRTAASFPYLPRPRGR
jgi:hypothetical protein